MKKVSWFVVVTLLLGGGWFCSGTWAQTPFQVPVNPQDSRPQTTAAPAEAPAGATFPSAAAPAGGHEQSQLKVTLELNGLIKQLRDAKIDPAKQAAMKSIRQLLERAFDRDISRREDDVSEIEGRIRMLREQIEKRKKAKDDIVGLELKTILNEAEGLGFPGLNDAGTTPPLTEPNTISNQAVINSTNRMRRMMTQPGATTRAQ
jgi:hypothetical protein